MTILLGIIGDDYTGSMMVASMLTAAGFKVTFVVDQEQIRAAVGDVVVVPTRTRFMPSNDAVEVFRNVTDELLIHEPRQVFYKYNVTFDSTADGNIGPLADYLSERLESPYTLFVPALPNNRVYVLEGHMFVRGKLLSESEKRFDPITPMPDSNLARVLASQTSRRVDVLPHDVLRGSVDGARAWLAAAVDRGIQYFIADTVNESDLDRIAAIASESPLITGADGIPSALAALSAAKAGAVRASPTRLPANCGAAVVLAGSCGLQTLRQLEHFRSSGHEALSVDLLDPRKPDVIVEDAADWVLERVGTAPVSVQTSEGQSGVKRTQSVLGVRGAAARAELILGLLAVRLRESGVSRFVIAGGETSGAVVDALGVAQIDVAPWTRELYCCWGVTCDANPISIMLKAGQIGPLDVFSRALETMAGP